MLTSFAMLVLFQVLGGLLQQVTGLPVPGPVIGVMLLLTGLIIDGSVPDRLERTAAGTLPYLPMLFVPGAVGMVGREGLVRGDWPALATATMVSSVAAICLTSLTITCFDGWRRTGRRSILLRRDPTRRRSHDR